jgi:hypothetical protein
LEAGGELEVALGYAKDLLDNEPWLEEAHGCCWPNWSEVRPKDPRDLICNVIVNESPRAEVIYLIDIVRPSDQELIHWSSRILRRTHVHAEELP